MLLILNLKYGWVDKARRDNSFGLKLMGSPKTFITLMTTLYDNIIRKAKYTNILLAINIYNCFSSQSVSAMLKKVDIFKNFRQLLFYRGTRLHKRGVN